MDKIKYNLYKIWIKFRSLEWYFQATILCLIFGFLYRFIDPETGFFIMLIPIAGSILIFLSIPGLIYWLTRFLKAKSK